MYKATPFQKTDYYTADLVGVDKEMCDGPNSEQFVNTWLRGPGWTIRYNNEIILMGGVTPYWEGVGEGWLLITKQLAHHTHFCIKFVVRALASMFDMHNYRRVQASVSEDFTKARRLVEWLGFKPEGRMPYYGVDGGHFIRYAITLEDNQWQQ